MTTNRLDYQRAYRATHPDKLARERRWQIARQRALVTLSKRHAYEFAVLYGSLSMQRNADAPELTSAERKRRREAARGGALTLLGRGHREELDALIAAELLVDACRAGSVSEHASSDEQPQPARDASSMSRDDDA